ncbi:MAG: hypothetical protein AAB775_00515 [Patescibacteria group bacterium]
MKITTAKFHKFGEIAKNLGSNPWLDWYFILLCFVLLLCAAVLVNLFFYDRLSLRGGKAVNIPNMTETLDREDINQAIQKLNDRELNFKNLPQTVFSDPSL